MDSQSSSLGFLCRFPFHDQVGATKAARTLATVSLLLLQQIAYLATPAAQKAQRKQASPKHRVIGRHETPKNSNPYPSSYYDKSHTSQHKRREQSPRKQAPPKRRIIERHEGTEYAPQRHRRDKRVTSASQSNATKAPMTSATEAPTHGRRTGTKRHRGTDYEHPWAPQRHR